MKKTTRKIFAVILLAILIIVPFIDWKLGAVFWMCAWLVYIFQNLFPKHHWKFGGDEEQDFAEHEDSAEHNANNDNHS